MERLLDPKNDVVFKLLLVRYPHVLVALLNAVLAPAVPIVAATVANPELPKSIVDEKGAVLDVFVEMDDGAKADLEMQMQVYTGLTSRLLYYWARLYVSGMSAGQAHTSLRPCYGIVILGENLWPTDRYHSTFAVLETHEHIRFSDHLVLHTLELPKLRTAMAGGSGPVGADVEWGRFFAATTDEELEELGMQYPEMKAPVEALKELSADTKARYAALERELAIAGQKILMDAAVEDAEARGKKEGKAEGKKEGKTEGKKEGTADAIVVVLSARGIALTEEQRRRVLAMQDMPTLERWLVAAATVQSADELV